MRRRHHFVVSSRTFLVDVNGFEVFGEMFEARMEYQSLNSGDIRQRKVKKI